MSKPRSIFLLSESAFQKIYSKASINEVCAITHNKGRLYSEKEILQTPSEFEDVEIIFGGWGTPVLNETLMEKLPALKALFYGAGSINYIVTEAFWKRNILITSAYRQNAVPVAQYTLASIIYALKKAWKFHQQLKKGVNGFNIDAAPGAYKGSKVGIVSLGAIGQLVCRTLTQLEVDILAYDPYVHDSVFEKCGATCVPSIEELFETCNVVSIHTPLLKETRGMINRNLLERMPEDACFINTSRGAVVNESDLLELLTKRSDLYAIIDVLTDEKSYHQSPFNQLPNVFITPHIAGSTGNECLRMGEAAVEECHRFLNGDVPHVAISREQSLVMA
ncbi:hydroxyacid dehydrogenase [Cerasicoccus maritimus]|uniref:hydroxyacid dehydrogenase n=1 Tax=Cerasicoccus maritimus TaxID=490089 RepID=UPI002852D1C5|nr:hydroxyacid dehydrogenase [Cerasicoccus maritimus]